MFTEYEIESLIEIEKVRTAAFDLQKRFIKKEAPYLEITNQDFLSLVLMAPTVGVALANGSVSFFEEMALNKKARKLSKGGYFLKKDPIVFALKFLIAKYDEWELEFFKVIKIAMEESFDIHRLEKSNGGGDISLSAYRMEVWNSPFILIRFIAAFFLNEDEGIINTRNANKTDFARIEDIGQKLGLGQIPVFRHFLQTFHVH